MSEGLWIAIICEIIIGLVGYFGFVVKISNRATVLETRCSEKLMTKIGEKLDSLQSSVDKLVQYNTTVDDVIRPHLARIIHSPTHPDRDALMDKWATKTINKEEVIALIPMLDEAANSSETENNKRWYFANTLARVEAELVIGRYG
jgi:hypothetical protein